MRFCVLRMPVSSPLWCLFWRPIEGAARVKGTGEHDSMRPSARASRSRGHTRRAIKYLALGPDLDIDEIALDRAGIDAHAEARSLRQTHEPVASRHQVSAGDLE